LIPHELSIKKEKCFLLFLCQYQSDMEGQIDPPLPFAYAPFIYSKPPIPVSKKRDSALNALNLGHFYPHSNLFPRGEGNKWNPLVSEIEL
jgi:hypothetical protein